MCFETPQPALFILHHQTHAGEHHITWCKGTCCNTGHLTCGPPGDLGVQGRALLCPGSPWAAYLRSRGFSLVRSAGLLSLSQLNHSSLFAVPVTHQTSASGYKRYFSLLTQARMFLSKSLLRVTHLLQGPAPSCLTSRRGESHRPTTRLQSSSVETRCRPARRGWGRWGRASRPRAAMSATHTSQIITGKST